MPSRVIFPKTVTETSAIKNLQVTQEFDVSMKNLKK